MDEIILFPVNDCIYWQAAKTLKYKLHTHEYIKLKEEEQKTNVPNIKKICCIQE
jgi:hypothetical protein